MRDLRVSEFVSMEMAGWKSCEAQMLFIFTHLLFRKLKCQHIYQFLLFYSAFYGIEEMNTKVRQNYFFQRGWQTML